MRIGSLVFSTEQGLGILAKMFYDAGVLTEVVTVAHGKRKEHPGWFPNTAFHCGNLHAPEEREKIRAWVKTLDAFIAFETPFLWDIFHWAKESGTKTALCPMHECMPKQPPALPDVIIAPSALDLDWAKLHCGNVPAVFIPVPVQVPYRPRERAYQFVHNTGNGGLVGRNGTTDLIRAWRHVKAPAKLVIRSQVPLATLSFDLAAAARDSRITIDETYYTHERLWENGGFGDVFLFPERFNGLSLPLQEAFAAGMFVMALDRFPINTWLPHAGLIEPQVFQRSQIANHLSPFEEAVCPPERIAAAVDFWYGRDIGAASAKGWEWAQSNSWERLKPLYLEALQK